MFVPGSLYKSKIGIPMISTTHHLTGACEWLCPNNFFTVIEINSNSNYFLVHAQPGVFKTSNLFHYVRFSELFEKVA